MFIVGWDEVFASAFFFLLTFVHVFVFLLMSTVHTVCDCMIGIDGIELSFWLTHSFDCGCDAVLVVFVKQN